MAYLNGVWHFNKEIYGADWGIASWSEAIPINFTTPQSTAAMKDFKGFGYHNSPESNQWVFYFTHSPDKCQGGMWAYAKYLGGWSSSHKNTDGAIVDFGSQRQYVPDEFYSWFVNNAVQIEQSEEKPIYLRTGDSWVKQTAYERKDGEWITISIAD